MLINGDEPEEILRTSLSGGGETGGALFRGGPSGPRYRGKYFATISSASLISAALAASRIPKSFLSSSSPSTCTHTNTQPYFEWSFEIQPFKNLSIRANFFNPV